VIVLDSSILVGHIREEVDIRRVGSVILNEQCAIGTPTLVECRIWCAMNLPSRSAPWLEEFIADDNVSIVPFSREMADVASQAFLAFGRRSGHRARLNFGDCMSYAVAAVLRAPLLFKGRDFGLTDVMAHPASIRD
jgi:ribonuclease VapC